MFAQSTIDTRLRPLEAVKAVRRLLADPNARAMAKEIFKCALAQAPAPLLTLPYQEPDGNPVVLGGELGLCQGASAARDWWNAAPTKTCLQLVTACVMARVNGLGQAVPLALHSPSQSWPAPADQFATETFLRETQPPGESDRCGIVRIGIGEDATPALREQAIDHRAHRLARDPAAP